jgi:endonuclease YncB( thermonuclease family)
MRRTLIKLVPLLVFALATCGPPDGARYSRKQAQGSLKALETPGLVIGEFRVTKIVDGDTIRVDGLDSSLRLLAMDCEETFKNNRDRIAAEADFAKYLIDSRGDSKHPTKAATPLGEDAKEFGKQFFEGVKKVRLERDNPKEIRDRFDRYLAYAIAEKGGRWVNYNVESVRAGMTPYFSKYGYSRRFHQEFVDAEREARANKVGIWDPAKPHYTDYDERKAWWTARAEFIAEFERQAKGQANFINLTDFDAMRRIEDHLDKEIVVLGTIGEVRLGDRGPSKVMLSRKMFGDFPIIFFDKDVLASTGAAAWRGEFIMVRGVVTVYVNKHNGRRQLQLVVNTPGQVVLSDIPGLANPQDVP